MKPDPKEPGNRADSQHEPDAAKTIGGWMIALLWIIAIAAGTYAAQGWFDRRDAARLGISVNDGENGQALVLRADRYGQFGVMGRANEVEIVFLVDTGATGISIPGNIADKMGLERGRPFQVLTANGTTTVYETRLDSLRIGPFERSNVRASINPSMDGSLALLGMSFLRHYELLQRSDELTISAP